MLLGNYESTKRWNCLWTKGISYPRLKKKSKLTFIPPIFLIFERKYPIFVCWENFWEIVDSWEDKEKSCTWDTHFKTHFGASKSFFKSLFAMINAQFAFVASFLGNFWDINLFLDKNIWYRRYYLKIWFYPSNFIFCYFLFKKHSISIC